MSSSLAESQSHRAPHPTRRSQLEQIVFALAVAATVFLVGIQTWRLMPSGSLGAIIAESRQAAASDADVGIIYKALRQKPTFPSTFGWWHEPWAGPFGYWRPLTSQCYWLEYHAFGPDRFDLWTGVMAVSHLCFTGLLAVLAWRLTGHRWTALLTAYLFAGARVIGPFSAWMFGNIPSMTTTYAWKNEPEVWAGICVIAAMLFVLSERWALAVILAAASVCFKESGWLTWPLVFLTLVPNQRFRKIPIWAYAMGLGLCLLLGALRSALSLDIYAGNHATNNVHWLSRYWGQVAGAYLTDLTEVSPPLAIFSLVSILVAQTRRISLLPKAGLIVLTFCICAACYGIRTGTDFETGIGCFLDWSNGLHLWLGDLCYLFAVLCLLRDPTLRRPALILIALILLSALPVIASVLVGNHTLYLTYGLQSALVALALVATAQTVYRGALSLTRNPGFPRTPKENL